MTRLALAFALVPALTACNLIVDLDDDEAIDATVIVFDAGDAVPIDGQFDPSNCALDLPCPAPDAGRATICGRLWDIETEQPIVSAAPTGATCAPGGGTDGPCSLRIRFFDALDFAQDPANAQPLPPQAMTMDDCGRYRGENLPRATFGFIAVTVDDALAAQDRHIHTGVALGNGEAVPALDVRAYATRIATDQAWTAAAGLGGGSFATRGVLLNVFLYHGMPVAGVQVRRNGSSIDPAETFAFSDPGITRSMVAPQQELTGPNGSVLIVNSPTPIAHDAVGGEPAGCVWPSSLGMSIPGAVFMQRKEAQTPGGASCP
jgi:hypothetical protein